MTDQRDQIAEVDDSLVLVEAPPGGWPNCDCGHEGLDPMFHFDCPISKAWRKQRKAARDA